MASSSATSSPVVRVEPRGFPYATPDPFLFCVYHNDKYPAGNPDNMFAPRRGNGADFDCARPAPRAFAAEHAARPGASRLRSAVLCGMGVALAVARVAARHGVGGFWRAASVPCLLM